jgi:hypothetical protein
MQTGITWSDISMRHRKTGALKLAKLEKAQKENLQPLFVARSYWRCFSAQTGRASMLGTIYANDSTGDEGHQ